MLNVGRGARIRETGGQKVGIRKKQEERGEKRREQRRQMKENKGPAHLMQIVQHLILFALNMAFANVQVISREIQSAGKGAKEEEKEVDKEEKEQEEAALQMPIVQLLTQSALSLVSASVNATSLEMLSAGVKEKQFVASVAVRLLEETRAASLTQIVLPPTRSAPSLAFASAAAINREMRSVGEEETLCALERILRNIFPLE